MKMNQLRLQNNCYKLLLLIQLMILVNNYSCSYAQSQNWLTANAWAKCYQASDGNLIGYSQGSFFTSWNGQTASWNYDYNNNIAFYQTTTSSTQRWGYRYHNSDTCYDYGSNGCCCGCGDINCYNSYWSCCDDGNGGCYNCWPIVDLRQWNYYNDYSVLSVVYLPCHWLCSSCTASWTNTSCQSCWSNNGRAYQWLAWGSATSYINTCDTVCPNDWQNGYSNAYPGQYIVSTVNYSPYCAQCNTSCSVCANDQGGQVCTVCVSNAALLSNYALCTQKFPNDPYCKTDNQCVFTSCPTNLYFWLPRSQTSNSSYPYTATGSWNFRVTNFCYLCHQYCLTCIDQYDYTCKSCAYSYYLWQQYPITYAGQQVTRCNYYCN
jgi:hypothetical protein